SQTVMSILNTLFNLCAHDMLRAWYGLSESFRCSAKRGLFLPRLLQISVTLNGAYWEKLNENGFLMQWQTVIPNGKSLANSY
ncbi:MAG: hypothetical protein U9Q87_15800, partial [Pseudomonadota bacterium]|nr:hypothetical protein [Pseudomonadota bacterium]